MIDSLHGRLNTYLVLVLAIVVAAALAVGLHYGIERVFHDWLRDAVIHGLRDHEVPAASQPSEPAPPMVPAQQAPPPVEGERHEPVPR